MNIGLIFAGGSGVRMNTKGMPKQFLQMNGKAIIIHTLEYFEKCMDIDAIIVVCLKEYIGYLDNLLKINRISKVKKIVPGGTCGQESIYHGLCAAEELAEGDDIVLIHDGVRPLISEDLLSNSIKMVKEKGNAITVTPATETIIQADEKQTITNIIDRKSCYIAKAPQSFYLEDILKVHRQAIKDNKTDRIDSASLMKEYGYELHTLEGSNENIKITNPSDFYILRAILEARENSQIFGL
ncbi:IspD/TarI family cytidylyltransferase [Blautia sp. HCP28S3_G10]|uniref:IspD/TarI family cytidylyltransferase n=1 Tax=Blautia sp. HCP28S3_G10 TaxID=3438908 RepID=UPI003F8B13FB